MIVMTMILTRLMANSSGFRAKSGINWAKQSRILETAAGTVKQWKRRRLALRSAPSERAACATDPVTLRVGIRLVFATGSALFSPLYLGPQASRLQGCD